MKSKTIKVLSVIGGVLGGVAALDAVPFVAPAVGAFIVGLSLALDRAVSVVGDFIDDGEINGSFGQ